MEPLPKDLDQTLDASAVRGITRSRSESFSEESVAADVNSRSGQANSPEGASEVAASGMVNPYGSFLSDET